MNNLAPAPLAGSAPSTEGTPHGDADWWFTALDQRLLSVGAERWLTQVVGVHTDGSDVWIQLQPVREQLPDFTIHVQPGMSVDEVLLTIEAQIREVTRRSP